MLIVIRGAGDLASGIAVRLYQSGFSVVMTDISQPTAVRTTVSFSSAVLAGATELEGIVARLAHSPEEALAISEAGVVAVLVDPRGEVIPVLRPVAVIDAILAKRNTGTMITDAPVVVGIGPGFTAGVDCHAAVETQRGHNLGRVYYSGSPMPDTGIPGNIGGYTLKRIIRAPQDGVFHPIAAIGTAVSAGETVAMVGQKRVVAEISGVIRGLLPEGTPVSVGMKAGDIDPRGEVDHCWTVSDKSRAIAGGVLEAIMHKLTEGSGKVELVVFNEK